MIYRDRIRMPPSNVTGELGSWLRDLAIEVNRMPRASWFSGTDPNSVVTGVPGDLVVNVGSASTNSRLWVMGGGTAVSTTGWQIVRIA